MGETNPFIHFAVEAISGVAVALGYYWYKVACDSKLKYPSNTLPNLEKALREHNKTAEVPCQ